MTSSSLRIVFAGTPEFAASHLQALIAAGFNVVSAYSQPDRPSGRGKKLLPTPVKALAQQYAIPVFQPLSLTDADARETLRAQRPDVMVVVAYGLLLPPEILALPRFGCINVHASLLPRWRGAAPIERAILAGDKETGVCIMQMDAGLDTGPVLRRVNTPVGVQDTSESVTARLVELGTQALCEVLLLLESTPAVATAQDPALALYAHKIHKREAEIDWSQPASHIDAQIRAFYPRVPAFTWFRGARLRLLQASALSRASILAPGTIEKVSDHCLEVACGDRALEIRRVQLEGKSAMSISSLHNGHPGYFQVGQQFSAAPAPGHRV